MNTEGDKHYEKPKMGHSMGIGSVLETEQDILQLGVWRGLSVGVTFGQRIKG